MNPLVFFVVIPGRINPGDKMNTLTKIKKVTSGYSSIITAGTHNAPSIKVVEVPKPSKKCNGM